MGGADESNPRSTGRVRLHGRGSEPRCGSRTSARGGDTPHLRGLERAARSGSLRRRDAPPELARRGQGPGSKIPGRRDREDGEPPRGSSGRGPCGRGPREHDDQRRRTRARRRPGRPYDATGGAPSSGPGSAARQTSSSVHSTDRSSSRRRRLAKNPSRMTGSAASSYPSTARRRRKGRSTRSPSGRRAVGRRATHPHVCRRRGTPRPRNLPPPCDTGGISPGGGPGEGGCLPEFGLDSCEGPGVRRRGHPRPSHG